MKLGKEQLIDYLISSGILGTEEIIKSFKQVDRKDFVPQRLQKEAYANQPLPLKDGQTISQPQTVATMTETLKPEKGQKILEIGAGSGYQAALLSEIVGPRGKVITLEIKESLYKMAKENLEKYQNITVLHKDGSKGHKQEAPFDRIIVTASAPEIPKPLIEQLKKGGRMVIPIGREMFLVEKNEEIKKTMLGYYVFVPLRGEHGH